ncbi:MAG: ABC transporter substrate-binding protein, partial [Chromatiales bacterium]|nr:ABC transporter substrate-binding protein [Chromatiales bacterium]
PSPTLFRSLTEFTARNGQALRTLREQHDIQLRRFPDAVLARLRAIADEVLEDLARRDPMTRRIHDSYRSFQQDVTAWHALSEAAIYGVRGGA